MTKVPRESFSGATETMNPLLNPLLEQNLSRWAEVYFTTPPEKRDDAVRELLRQLHVEVHSSAPDPGMAASAHGDTPATETTPIRTEAPPARWSALSPEEPHLVCASCGSMNTTDQQFCGFCGSPLSAGPIPSEHRDTGSRAEMWSGQDPYQIQHSDYASEQHQTASPGTQGWDTKAAAAETHAQQSYPAEAYPAETVSFLGLDSPRPDNDLQFLREKSFGSDYYEQESTSHWGRYLGGGLAIILAGLIYFEWPVLRSHLQSQTHITTQAPASAAVAPQTPQPAAMQPTGNAEGQSPNPAASSSAEPATAAAPASTAAVVAATPVSGAPDRKTSIPNGDIERSGKSAQPLTLAAHTEGTAPVPDGTQELLMAQRYLEGRGVPHDSVQAAALLWKAVGKQNARADVLLADLYAQGDGVSKSCDQARLLLLAAAKKNAPGAEEKLRGIESGSCR